MNAIGASADEVGSQATTPEEISRFVVEAAVHAPSVLNTQPWWFSTGERDISVHADVERRLRLADPQGREMMISCGAAVFTARVAIRYLGFVPRVGLLPDPDLPNLVARIGWDDRTPAVEYERQLYAEIARRRTHRGGFDSDPLPAGLLSALRDEAAREHATLQILGDDRQRAALGAVVAAADAVLRLNPSMVAEESKWAPPPGSQRRDGVPATAYPARPERTEPAFPSRDFSHGHGWGLPPAGGSGGPARDAGVVALVTTPADHPADWINAGQALQRVLLAAAVGGVSAALHSQPLELPQLRDLIREHFSGGVYPQMVLRLGTTGEAAVSVRRRIEDVLL